MFRELDVATNLKSHMNLKSIFLFVALLSLTCTSNAQSDLQLANIGDFKTTNGDIIKDCVIGYRTIGKLNAEKNNVVLFPTWLAGTSEHINNSFANSIIDTSGLYIIVVDALTNGVSSSPSNTEDFPTITTRDMVNSQYLLLVNHLNIKHVYAVMGISLGGMQTLEWTVAYPDFMDKAISIVGTPKLSSYDMLVWQTMEDLLTEAEQEPQKLDFAYKLAYNIFLMNINTPTLFAKTQNPDNLDIFLEQQYSTRINPKDYMAGIKTILQHDIYKSSNCTKENIKNIIKADVLIISAAQDHLVTPISAIELSKELNAELLLLQSDCGHGLSVCEAESIKNAITKFLSDK